MNKSVLEVIREVEQELSTLDWSIQAPAPGNYAARVGRALGQLQILRINMEWNQESNARKIAALKSIQERI